MIPPNQRRGNVEIVCDFRPMTSVGGDYASVHFQSDQRVVVGICDVAGHGVASALLATRVNSFVLDQAPRVCHPCQLVDSRVGRVHLPGQLPDGYGHGRSAHPSWP